MENPSDKTTATAAPTMKTPARLLVDSRTIQLQLVEDGTKPGKVIMRGEFARCGVATENKRVYPQRLWERELNRLNKAMEGRQLYGELDHPSDGRTQLTRASHLVTNLEIKDGLIVGEAEILDTARGRDLKAILQAGGRVGISSRGYGSTRPNDKGEEIVQEDYRLVTFDFVADPADQTAFPDVYYESKGNSMERDAQEQEQDLAQKFAAQIDAAKKESREATEAALRDEFAKELVTRLSEVRSEVTESVRAELLADPTVAGAKSAIEAIKAVVRDYVLPEDAKAVAEAKDAEIVSLKKTIAEQSLRIKELEDGQAKLESVAKEAGYKYFVEKAIAGDPDAGLIRKLIGDVTKYDGAQELKLKIESVRTDLESKRAESTALSEQIEADKRAERERKDKERVRALKQEKALREENEKLRSALRKSLEANKALGLQVYAESRLANHPKASKIRSLIESSNPGSREDVDSLIEQVREPARDPETLEAVRARVRAATRGGIGPTALDEEAPQGRRANGHYTELGIDLEELKTLSGMSGPATRNR